MTNTSVAQGNHFEEFMTGQLASRRYASVSDIMRDALRLREAKSNHREAVIAALIEGEQSGISDRNPEDIRAAVKQEWRLDGRDQPHLSGPI